MRARKRNWASGSISIGACAMGALAIVASGSSPSHAEPGRIAPSSGSQKFDAASTVCGDGLEAIAQDACFSAPSASADKDAAHVPLLIYLHGIFQPDAPASELDRQTRVARHAVARGYAVLALYGRQGICNTRGDHLTSICWPSNEQVAHYAPEVVASWKEPLARARQRTGHAPTYVLGFSNGAYFAGLLAVRDLFAADAFVVAQGGPVEPVHALGKRAPILLLSTDEEAPEVHAEMDRFGSELAADGWSFVEEERSGGHELADQDIEAALDFFAIPSHTALH